MTADIKAIKQWACLTALVLVGFAAFLVLAGEEAPNEPPMPFGKFLAIKAGAMAVFALCALLGKYLYRKGLLPEIEED